MTIHTSYVAPLTPPSNNVAVEQQAAIRVTPTSQTSGQEAQSATTGATDPRHDKTPQDDSSLETAIQELNRSMQAWSTQLRFEADRDAQRVIIRIVDTESGEVIKTIPAESVIQAARLIAPSGSEADGLQAQA